MLNGLDELTHHYVTRSELDGLRHDMRSDFNRLNDSISKLVEQMLRTAVTQERMVIVWENTNQRFEETGKRIENLTMTISDIQTERTKYKAKWELLFGFKSLWTGLLKFFLMIITFSLVSEGGVDFFHWIKLTIKHKLGI